MLNKVGCIKYVIYRIFTNTKTVKYGPAINTDANAGTKKEGEQI